MVSRCESDSTGSQEGLMVALFNLHPTRVGTVLDQVLGS